jgi:hypothetical protein
MFGSPLPLRAALASLFFLVASRASAHALNVSVEPGAPGAKVTVVAYFDDDTPAQEAKVVVKDSGGAFLEHGVTDERGMWTFTRPQPGRYQIFVDAGTGHRKDAPLNIPVDPSAAVAIDAPSRAEFTHFPWLALGGGVGFLGLFATGAWLRLRSR